MNQFKFWAPKQECQQELPELLGKYEIKEWHSQHPLPQQLLWDLKTCIWGVGSFSSSPEIGQVGRRGFGSVGVWERAALLHPVRLCDLLTQALTPGWRALSFPQTLITIYFVLHMVLARAFLLGFSNPLLNKTGPVGSWDGDQLAVLPAGSQCDFKNMFVLFLGNLYCRKAWSSASLSHLPLSS